MAKRYYQSKKDRRNESRGMKRYERNKGDGMISSDNGLFPKGVMMKEYPTSPYINQGGYPDTIRGVDYAIGQSVNSKSVIKKY